MKAFHRYIIPLLVVIVFLQGCGQENTLPNLRETYNYKDPKPFGGEVAHTLLTAIYPDKYININKRSFADFRANTYVDESSFYMSISKRFYTSEADASALIDYVREGNTAFIASSYMDTSFLDKVFCKQGHNEWATGLSQGFFTRGKTSVNDTFSYFFDKFFNYFSIVDPLSGRVLGRNDEGKPNFIIIFLGKGRLYLHCEARAFSNYFLLTGNNYRYMLQAMQYTQQKPGNIFWDNYYNTKSVPDDEDQEGSALGALLDHPPLAAAFWLLLILLLLYILFNGKRKQRIIPIIKPVENTSVEFTQAISALYMAEKNNKSIADKMITYFNEHIRNKYFLSGQGSGKDFVQTLSKKSGVSFESVQALYNTIEQVQLSTQVSDFELLTLNEQIQQFYKNRN